MEFTRKDILKQLYITRRNVIKLIIGGAAGINLSPLPWKLTDDIAIWTQNWPWVPVPPKGEFNHVKSVCTLCPGGCGIEVRKVDGRAIKIEGRTDYPVNPGGICPIGAGGLQLLYNENIRFTGPMKRVGPRGSGKYAPVSWEEALEILGDRIRSLRENGHPERLAAVNGYPSRSSMSLLVERLFEAVGSPNCFRMPDLEDTYGLINRLMQGNAGPMSYDLENADFILSFGCGLIEGWGAPGRMLHTWGLWHNEPGRKKVRIVQIESRASTTASKAGGWLAPRPGTEAALALGLAHVIIREGLYDTSFIRDYTFGFVDGEGRDGKKGFKTLVLEKYSPDAVSKITGVAADHIVTLARDFARSRAPVALYGKGKGELNGSVLEGMAVHSLNALVGNINMPGGVLVHDPLPLKPWPDVQRDGIARSGLKNARLDQAGDRKNPFSGSLIHHFSGSVLKNERTPVDTLLVFAANPAYGLPDAGVFFNALKRIPFIVGFSPFRDETALMADLVLPDHTYLEKREDIVWPPGMPYPVYGLSRPVVAPVYNTGHSGDVIIKLAEGIGAAVKSAFPWKDFDAALKERVKGLYESGSGLTRYDEAKPVWEDFAARKNIESDYPSFNDLWERLKSDGLWYRPVHVFKKWDTIFRTPSGKFEFYSTAIEKNLNDMARGGTLASALRHLGMDPATGKDESCMPHYEPILPSADREKYPLLMVPYSLINLSSGWAPSPPYIYKTLFDDQVLNRESFADIHPQTASEYGVRQGDHVVIFSSRGELKARVNLFEGAMPGVVYLPAGLGHWAYDPFQKDKGVNPNSIIDPGADPLSGQMIWWGTQIQIKKV